MDWTVVSGITGGMKRYKEAYKAGRMDLVAAEEKQIEQGFKILESGTNVQATRQTMGFRETEEQRTAQMFGPKLGQAKQDLKTSEQSYNIIKEDRQQESEQYAEAARMLFEKYGVDVRDVRTLSKVADAMTAYGKTEIESANIQAGVPMAVSQQKKTGAEYETKVNLAKGAANVPEESATSEAAGYKFARESAEAMSEANAAQIAAKMFVEKNSLAANEDRLKTTEILEKQKSGYYNQLWEAQQSLIPLLLPREQAEIDKLSKESNQASASYLKLLRQIEMEDKMKAYLDAQHGEGYYDKMIANKMVVDAGMGLTRQDYITQYRILTTAAASIQSKATAEEVMKEVKTQWAGQVDDKGLRYLGGMLGSGGGGSWLSPKEKNAAIMRIDNAIKALEEQASNQGLDLSAFLNPITGGSADFESELDTLVPEN